MSDASSNGGLYRTTVVGKISLELTAGTVAASAHKPNEDAYSLIERNGIIHAAVFDGTTSLKPISALGHTTGARYASQFLKDHFAAVTTESPRAAMLQLNRKLLEASRTLGGSLTDTHSLPASTATIICLDPSSSVRFAHVGDSFGIAYYQDKRSVIFTDDKNKKFDTAMFSLIDRIAKKKQISPKEARATRQVKDALVDMFVDRNNNPNGKGSGLLNGDPNLELYVQSGTLALHGVVAILLGTDGLVPPGWDIENEESRQKLRDTLTEGGFCNLFELKHEAEDSDPEWQNIRYKHSDDATGILVTFKS